MDTQTTIALTGSPRSGTTWLANALADEPGASTLFEPLHLDEVPAARRAGFRWRTYVDPEIDWPEGEAFMRKVLEGRVLNGWTTREIHSIQRVRRWVIKFVRANRLLPWLTRHFDIRPPVLLIRHPCAVVSSRLARGWPTGLGFRDDDHPFGSEVGRYVANLRHPEERLAAQWAIDILVPFTTPQPWPWEVVWYETLTQQGSAYLEPLFRRLALAMPERLETALSTPSSTTTKRDPRRDPVASWKFEFGPERIDRVLAVVRRMGVDLYGEDPWPSPRDGLPPPAP